MAEDEKGKKSSMVMIVVLVVVGLILAGGISYYIANKIVADRAATSKNASHEPGVFVKIGDPKDGLIVNVGGVNSGRYLKTSIIIELKPDKKEANKDAKALSPDEVKILDCVVFVLRSQKIADFEPAKQEKLKEVLKNEINQVLGGDRVYDVYITNLVLQ